MPETTITLHQIYLRNNYHTKPFKYVAFWSFSNFRSPALLLSVDEPTECNMSFSESEVLGPSGFCYFPLFFLNLIFYKKGVFFLSFYLLFSSFCFALSSIFFCLLRLQHFLFLKGKVLKNSVDWNYSI